MQALGPGGTAARTSPHGATPNAGCPCRACALPPNPTTWHIVPSGYLILYYVGVFKVLEQLGIIEPGVRAPPVAGASSGALTSAAICSGQSAQQFYDSVRRGLGFEVCSLPPPPMQSASTWLAYECHWMPPPVPHPSSPPRRRGPFA